MTRSCIHRGYPIPHTKIDTASLDRRGDLHRIAKVERPIPSAAGGVDRHEATAIVPDVHRVAVHNRPCNAAAHMEPPPQPAGTRVQGAQLAIYRAEVHEAPVQHWR